MADNILKVREIVFNRLNADGSPITIKTADDAMLIDYGQSVGISYLYKDGTEIENVGPLGTICKVKMPDEFTGCQADMQVAKRSNLLSYMIQGGTYDSATDVHVPPFSTDDAPNPVSVDFYCEIYDDGDHFHGEQTGYFKFSMPKATGRFSSESFGNDAFSNPSLTLTGKEYIDGTQPANSKPCYYITDSATLPSEGSYSAPFHITGTLGVDLVGAVVSVTVNGAPVTDTSDAEGLAELTLPYGVHSYTVTMDAYTTKTGTITVGLVNGVTEVAMVAS